MNLEATIREWSPYACTIARNIARRMRGVDRDDLESAALMGIVEAANTYDDQGSFRSWLSVIVKRRSLDAVYRVKGRTRKSRNGRSVETLPLLEFNDACARAEQLNEVRLCDEMDQCRRMLDERERLIFDLRVAGYAMPEIARRAGCSEQWCYRLIDRIAWKVAASCGRPERAAQVAEFLVRRGAFE